MGAGAVTAGKFANNVIVAGNPAKVIRTGVTWSREITYLFDYDMLSEVNGEEVFC